MIFTDSFRLIKIHRRKVFFLFYFLMALYHFKFNIDIMRNYAISICFAERDNETFIICSLREEFFHLILFHRFFKLIFLCFFLYFLCNFRVLGVLASIENLFSILSNDLILIIILDYLFFA